MAVSSTTVAERDRSGITAGSAAIGTVDGGRTLLRRIAVGTALTDVVSIAGALLAAYSIRFGAGELPVGYGLLIVLAPIVWLGTFAGFRLYGARHFAPEEEFRRIVTASAVGMAVAIMASYWSKASYSRIWIGLAFVLALAFELASRRGWRAVRARLEARGAIALPTLVVGTNDEARELAALLAPGSGFALAGYVATTKATPDDNVIGGLHELDEVLAWSGAQCVLVAASAVDIAGVCRIAAIARRRGVEMRISSRLPEVLTTRLAVQRIGAVPTISVMPQRLTPAQRLVKRGFDALVASCALVVLSPLLFAIGLLVRATSHGPTLFRQERVTRLGRRFWMLKFRTMREGDAAADPRPFAKNGHEDPRVTRLGRILRRCSLDELPQLINVVRGEMSLVGPRPLPTEQVLANGDLLVGRDEVPAGMTGWWQISGRSDLPAEEAAGKDRFYIENWSVAYDLYILGRTLGVVLRGRGAR